MEFDISKLLTIHRESEIYRFREREREQMIGEDEEDDIELFH